MSRRVANSRSKQPFNEDTSREGTQKSLTWSSHIPIVFSVKVIAKLFKLFFGILDLVVGEERPHRKIQIVEELSSLNDCE